MDKKEKLQLILEVVILVLRIVLALLERYLFSLTNGGCKAAPASAFRKSSKAKTWHGKAKNSCRKKHNTSVKTIGTRQKRKRF